MYTPIYTYVDVYIILRPFLISKWLDISLILVKDIHNAHVLVTVLNYKLNRGRYVLQSKGKTALYDIHMYFAHKLHPEKLRIFCRCLLAYKMALASVHKQNGEVRI